MNPLLAAGALINAALFLTGVFVLALMTGCHLGVALALLSVACAALSYVSKMAKGDLAAIFAAVISWALAIDAAVVTLKAYGL